MTIVELTTSKKENKQGKMQYYLLKNILTTRVVIKSQFTVKYYRTGVHTSNCNEGHNILQKEAAGRKM